MFKSQCQVILDVLLKKGKVTSLELEHSPYNITNPRGRMSDLRAKGIWFAQKKVRNRKKIDGMIINKDYFEYSLPNDKAVMKRVKEVMA